MTVSLHDLAEALHAEQHSGTFVPSLDGCPVHNRKDWEDLVRRRYPHSVACDPHEYRLWNDQGTNKIYVRHDPCGTDSEPVWDLAAAEHFRDQHVCPEGAAHA